MTNVKRAAYYLIAAIRRRSGYIDGNRPIADVGLGV